MKQNEGQSIYMLPSSNLQTDRSCQFSNLDGHRFPLELYMVTLHVAANNLSTLLVKAT